MKLKPKVSVVTVCFNAENTIANAISSVNSQSYLNLEHVFVDGKSNDDTLKVIYQRSKKASKVISENDKGIYDAMNKGVKHSLGDIIAFLNADDYYADGNLISEIVDVMVDFDLDFIYGDVSFIDPKFRNKVVRKYSSKIFKPSLLAYGLMPAHPSIFMRRELFNELGGFKLDYEIAGDFEFMLRLYSRDDISYRYIEKVFVYMLPGGVSTSGLRSTLMITKEMMRACRSNSVKTSFIRLCSRYLFKIPGFFRR